MNRRTSLKKSQTVVIPPSPKPAILNETPSDGADVNVTESEAFNTVRFIKARTIKPVKSVILASNIEKISVQPSDEIGSNLDEDLNIINQIE